MIRSYKIRLFPNKEQEELMWQHIGTSRWLWNYMLALQQARYETGEKPLSRFDMIKLLTPLKKNDEFSWLSTVSTSTLQKEIKAELFYLSRSFLFLKWFSTDSKTRQSSLSNKLRSTTGQRTQVLQPSYFVRK